MRKVAQGREKPDAIRIGDVASRRTPSCSEPVYWNGKLPFAPACFLELAGEETLVLCVEAPSKRRRTPQMEETTAGYCQVGKAGTSPLKRMVTNKTDNITWHSYISEEHLQDIQQVQ